MRRPRPPSCALLVAAGLIAGVAPARAVPPRLVVMIAVDQLRPDRIRPDMPGGFGRLLREGRAYLEASVDHAITETCPGHATLLTGRHPAAAGIPANRFLDVEKGRRVYCVSDDPERAAVLGFEEFGRSPRNLRVGTLGDWMKAADPESRVFAVAGKDRSAIVMGGHRADAAYWFSEQGSVGFTSSRYYLDELPEWLVAMNGEPPGAGVRERVPERWDHDPAAVRDVERPDDFPGEDDRYDRTSGHPLRDGDLETFAEQLFASPFIDLLTLDVARELAEREALGRDATPDLLAISLSGQDIVGHLYGPYSHESADALARLDRGLADFLAFLEERVGAERLLVVLSSDHGVLPLPEWLAATGEPACLGEKDGRAGLAGLGLGLLWRLHWQLSPFAWPRSWVDFAGWQIGVKRPLARSRGVEVAEAVAVARDYLESQPVVERVWTLEDLNGSDSEWAELVRHSFDPERSGDLLVQAKPGCLISFYDSGTTHGTPYWYDRHVPLVFWGPGIEPARLRERVHTVDIAPTLARRLGVEAPEDLDGRPLFE